VSGTIARERARSPHAQFLANTAWAAGTAVARVVETSTPGSIHITQGKETVLASSPELPSYRSESGAAAGATHMSVCPIKGRKPDGVAVRIAHQRQAAPSAMQIRVSSEDASFIAYGYENGAVSLHTFDRSQISKFSVAPSSLMQSGVPPNVRYPALSRFQHLVTVGAKVAAVDFDIANRAIKLGSAAGLHWFKSRCTFKIVRLR
jgi:hypothetical protein